MSLKLCLCVSVVNCFPLSSTKNSPDPLQPSGDESASHGHNFWRETSMVRRSAPALLGLFVCLLAAHLSSAAPAFRLDESRIRLSLESDSARVRVEVENGTGRDLPARLRVELLDPHDH